MTDDTDPQTERLLHRIEEQQGRIDELEETVQKMMPSRRQLLAGAGIAGASALTGGALTGGASAAPQGQIGTSSTPVDTIYADTLDVGTAKYDQVDVDTNLAVNSLDTDESVTAQGSTADATSKIIGEIDVTGQFAEGDNATTISNISNGIYNIYLELFEHADDQAELHLRFDNTNSRFYHLREDQNGTTTTESDDDSYLLCNINSLGNDRGMRGKWSLFNSTFPAINGSAVGFKTSEPQYETLVRGSYNWGNVSEMRFFTENEGTSDTTITLQVEEVVSWQ